MQAAREPFRPVQRRPRAVTQGRLLALCCLLLLGTLAGQTWGAQLIRDGQALLATLSRTPAFAVGGLNPVSRGAPNAGRVRAALVDSTGLHQYWQVGLIAGPDARDAVAMRTAIVTRLPEAVASNTTDYFWIGSYLADGSFIQIGYYVPWYDQHSAGWFYCAFTAAGLKGPCVYGSAGSAGANGEAHSYALEAAPLANAGTVPAPVSLPVVWHALVDGADVGYFIWTTGTTGQNSPSIYAESSGFVPHDATSQLGPVDFPLSVQTRAAGQSSYATTSHMRPAYAAPDICPSYGVRDDHHGGALLGTGLPCPADDDWLW